MKPHRLSIALFCLALASSAGLAASRNFPDFATSDLMRHARAKQLTDGPSPNAAPKGQKRPQPMPQAQRRVMRPVEAMRPEPSNQVINQRPFPQRSTTYDNKGNRVKKAVLPRPVQPSKPRPVRSQPPPRSVQPYQQQQQRPYGPPARPSRSNERPAPAAAAQQPAYNERPAYQYPQPPVVKRKAVSQQNQAPEPFTDYVEEPYVARSGPAVAPSNVNAAYVESPYGYEAPPEQRNIQEAVFRGAEAYQSRGDDEGVYQHEDRLSFHIHGHDGPHSYRYGYDTGHGYNRQFRYEERDGKGYLKGRYGFFDKQGELQVVNYSADPHKGFHAEGPGVPEYPH